MTLPVEVVTNSNLPRGDNLLEIWASRSKEGPFPNSPVSVDVCNFDPGSMKIHARCSAHSSCIVLAH